MVCHDTAASTFAPTCHHECVTTDNRHRLGEAIRRARETMRLTQQQLADRLHVQRRTVQNWESGRTVPMSSIGALEQILDVDLRHLVRDVDFSEADARDFREWFGIRRRKLGLTSIRSVAARVGVAHETIRRLEYGRTARPEPKTLRRIAETMRIEGEDPDDLYAHLCRLAGYPSESGFEPYTPPPKAHMLSRRQRELVDALINALVDASMGHQRGESGSDGADSVPVSVGSGEPVDDE